jgi:hypothetical protein
MVLVRAAADHLSTKLIALTAVLMGQLLIMLIIIGAPLLRPLNGKEIADSQTRLRARSSKPCVFFFSLMSLRRERLKEMLRATKIETRMPRSMFVCA